MLPHSLRSTDIVPETWIQASGMIMLSGGTAGRVATSRDGLDVPP